MGIVAVMNLIANGVGYERVKKVRLSTVPGKYEEIFPDTD